MVISLPVPSTFVPIVVLVLTRKVLLTCGVPGQSSQLPESGPPVGAYGADAAVTEAVVARGGVLIGSGVHEGVVFPRWPKPRPVASGCDGEAGREGLGPKILEQRWLAQDGRGPEDSTSKFTSVTRPRGPRTGRPRQS